MFAVMNTREIIINNKIIKITLGPYLTLCVRNGPNLQNYVIHAYTSFNSSRIHNVNFQAFTHLRNKTRFFEKVKY